MTMTPNATPWHPMDKTPKPWVRIVLRCSLDGCNYYGLTYCAHRGEIIEPINNTPALPKLGPCDAWRYDERDAA